MSGRDPIWEALNERSKNKFATDRARFINQAITNVEYEHPLAGIFSAALWGVSACAVRSANMRKHERHAKGLFCF